jgi:biotin carboxylase
MRNIFIIGLDDFTHEILQAMPDADEMALHALLTAEEAHGGRRYPVAEMLRLCREQLDRQAQAGCSIDAIIGLWDYPVSAMAHLLSREYGLPHPTLESVFKCEHKYWSRVEQRKVLPEMVPPFARFSPYDDDPAAAIDIAFPYWVKPIKAFGSHLAFKVEDEQDLRTAAKRMRGRIDHFRDGFSHLMSYADVPDDIRNGGFAIAESIIRADRQCTLEGYIQNDAFHVHGIVDSIPEEGVPSFNRFQHPSNIDPVLKERMAEAAEAFMRGLGYREAPFNMEFFHDEKEDVLHILEINPRVSHAHAELFRLVDGTANYRIPIQIQLGEPVEFPLGQGEYAIAAMLYDRAFEPGVVRKTPSQEDIRSMEERISSLIYEPEVAAGDELADQPFQDSYSYKLAHMFLGAGSEAELLEKYERIRAELRFDIQTQE